MKTTISLFKLLHGMYATKVPVIVFGNAGIGKTSIIKQLGRTLGVTTITKSSSKVTDVDLSGIPYLQEIAEKNTKTDVVNQKMHKEVRISVPTYIQQLNGDPNGILFFDELGTAPIDIQKQMLSIIQDCELNDFTIPSTTFRIAASNYSNISGNKIIQQALLNRFCHIHATANVDEFCAGFVSSFSNYELAKINSKEEQENKLIQYKMLIVDFLKAHPQYLENMPEDVVDECDQAFPSPRSWENVAKVMAVLDGNEEEYLEVLVCGLVGDAIGKIFLQYCSENDLFNIDLREYVGKEQTFVLPNPDKHSEVYHIISALMAYVKLDAKKYIKLWTRIINVLHNKDHKFGDYTGYDNFIMTFMHASMQIFTENGLISAEQIQSWAGNKPGVKPEEILDDYNELASLSSSISLS